MRDASPSEKKLGFQIHALAFVVGMAALFIINYFTGPHYLWAFWALLGWGIGLLAHWWFVLGPGAVKSPAGGARQG